MASSAKINHAAYRQTDHELVLRFKWNSIEVVDKTLLHFNPGVRGELLAESRKHQAVKILRQILLIGPLRAALLLALMQTPTGSAASASCGPTAVWEWRRTTARSIVMWMSASRCARPLQDF